MGGFDLLATILALRTLPASPPPAPERQGTRQRRAPLARWTRGLAWA